mmetsp:Transcript_49273/g.94107  ORF Transcript_49273/g.94107 Transcript_49273/m.94107 type:complete len:153 (-) Transcript_49273:1378-1836(-)
MPYPQNLATAKEVEAVVRSAGAVPATIAILDGVAHIGLTDSELERLAKLGHCVRKTSRRDLPAVIGMGLNGSTTVSATMLLAARDWLMAEPASVCLSRVELEACTGGEKAPWMCLQTSQSSDVPLWRWFALEQSPCWIYRAPWSTWRLKGCA